MSDFDNSDGNCKPRPPKFISILLLTNKDILNNLQLLFK